MRRPSFQFYPADWLGNPNLKGCTHAEKGIWMDILCLLHDGDQYGVLRWPLKRIALAVGASLASVKSLADKGVLKGSDTRCEAFIYVPRSGRKNGEPVTIIDEQDGPLWFSSRMVTDEYKGMARGGSQNASPLSTPITTPKPSPKDAPKPSPKATNGDDIDAHQSPHPPRAITPAAPSSSSSTSSDQSKDRSGADDDLADQIWEIAGKSPTAYRVAGKIDDQRLVRSWLAEGFTVDQVRAAAKAVIDRAGEIKSLWKLLAAAMPEELERQKAESDRPPDDGIDPRWRKRVQSWLDSGRTHWLESQWGERPDHWLTEVPKPLLEEFGIVRVVEEVAQ